MAKEFLQADIDAMARSEGEPCWSSLERFYTFRADGSPCDGDDWDEERGTELIGFRASREG